MRGVFEALDEYRTKIIQLRQELAEVQAAKRRNDQCYRELADVTDNLRARWVQAEAERDAARAGLGRAVDILADAATCLEMARHVSSESSGHIERALQTARACRTILADPQGQQAAAEWRRLKAVANAAKEHEDAKERYSQAMRERDFDVAAAAQSDELHAHTALLTALAALQQPPAGEERQQDG